MKKTKNSENTEKKSQHVCQKYIFDLYNNLQGKVA